MSSEGTVRDGWALLRAGDIAGAREIFEAALADEETPEALEGLAEATYLETDYSSSAALYERAFASFRRAGGIAGAARCARALGWIHGNIKGDWAVRSGWVGRARSVLEAADEDSAEHGWLQMLLAHDQSELPAVLDHLRRAHDLGRKHGDPNLEFEALGWSGLIRVLMAGEFESGLATLDEALTGVLGGEVHELLVVEGSFCGMLWACEVAQDVPRAQQWVRAADELRRRRKFSAMAAFCRAHYGAILTAAGRWSEAETELVEATRMFERTDTRMRINAVVRLADLRVRQGRFEEAEQLLSGLDRHPDALRPLAALHLARGSTSLARDVVDRGLGGPIGESGDAALLALVVEIAIKQGKIEDASAASARLAALAKGQGAGYLPALAALAQGQVCVATGSEEARACLEDALNGFARAEMPMELALARLELARAVAEERPEVAIAESKAALETFERLIAARHADAAGALLRQLGAPVRTGAKGLGALTKRESEVLQLLGHGLSNPEISDRLYISRKTVEHHVGSILSKLQLRSRAEAAAYAARAEEKSAQI